MEVVHGLHQALHPLVQLRQIKHGVVKLVVEFGEDRGHKIDTGTDRPLGGSSTRPSASPLPRSRPPFGVHVPDGTPPRVSGAVVDIFVHGSTRRQPERAGHDRRTCNAA